MRSNRLTFFRDFTLESRCLLEAASPNAPDDATAAEPRNAIFNQTTVDALLEQTTGKLAFAPGFLSNIYIQPDPDDAGRVLFSALPDANLSTLIDRETEQPVLPQYFGPPSTGLSLRLEDLNRVQLTSPRGNVFVVDAPATSSLFQALQATIADNNPEQPLLIASPVSDLSVFDRPFTTFTSEGFTTAFYDQSSMDALLAETTGQLIFRTINDISVTLDPHDSERILFSQPPVNTRLSLQASEQTVFARPLRPEDPISLHRDDLARIQLQRSSFFPGVFVVDTSQDNQLYQALEAILPEQVVADEVLVLSEPSDTAKFNNPFVTLTAGSSSYARYDNSSVDRLLEQTSGRLSLQASSDDVLIHRDPQHSDRILFSHAPIDSALTLSATGEAVLARSLRPVEPFSIRFSDLPRLQLVARGNRKFILEDSQDSELYAAVRDSLAPTDQTVLLTAAEAAISFDPAIQQQQNLAALPQNADVPPLPFPSSEATLFEKFREFAIPSFASPEQVTLPEHILNRYRDAVRQTNVHRVEFGHITIFEAEAKPREDSIFYEFGPRGGGYTQVLTGTPPKGFWGVQLHTHFPEATLGNGHPISLNPALPSTGDVEDLATSLLTNNYARIVAYDGLLTALRPSRALRVGRAVEIQQAIQEYARDFIALANRSPALPPLTVAEIRTTAAFQSLLKVARLLGADVYLGRLEEGVLTKES